ncbi:MAG TPA: MerR family transcriptional regulator [Acidobacteria bacterium]|nr:MerR family transcriptional regulator [Acidobacteriota bacterium]
MKPAETHAFDISELARRAAVSSRTIRYYEELGLLHPAARGGGGRRLYDLEALERLQFISRLKTLGLTLDEIGALARAFDAGSTPAMLDELERLLDAHIEEVTDRVRQLEQLGRQLREYRQRIRARRQGGK